MASTYTTNLQLEKVTTGEKAGLWGTVTNTNLEILEQASSGYLSVDVASADVTLTLTNGSTSNGKNLFFVLTGTWRLIVILLCLLRQRESLLLKIQRHVLQVIIL